MNDKFARLLSWEFVLVAVAQLGVLLWYVSAHATEQTQRIESLEKAQVSAERIARIEERLVYIERSQQENAEMLRELLRETRASKKDN